MRYFLNQVDPRRWEDFLEGRSDGTWGFTERHRKSAQARVRQGDRLICYMIRHKRWCGVLEVAGGLLSPEDSSVASDSELPVRFRVKSLTKLSTHEAICVFEPGVWDGISVTRDRDPRSPGWNARLRADLSELGEDGAFLDRVLQGRRRQVEQRVPLPEAGDTASFDPASAADGRIRIERQIVA